jgi:hypothetical protein
VGVNIIFPLWVCGRDVGCGRKVMGGCEYYFFLCGCVVGLLVVEEKGAGWV